MKVPVTPVALWVIAMSIAQADEPSAPAHSVLQSLNHPQSPEYTSVYSDVLTPIDNRFSWTNRFKGDARFNSPQRVEIEQRPLQQSPAESASNSGFDATGVVKKVDPLTQKVKLAHGPIDRLGMPAMTMVFKASDASLLGVARVGQEVGFNVTDTDEGYVLTTLTPLNALTAQPAGDALGVIKSIRNGKIKLKHGPIEKFGMPGMTMMFTTADPSMLDGLAPGTEVEFDVDSTDSGFTITRIKTLRVSE